VADARVEHWDGLVAQARLHLGGGDPARLEATAREMIALDPDHEMGYRFVAESLLRRGDAAGAVRLGEEALARAPDSDFVHYRLSVFLRLKGDRKAAREHVGKAIEKDPEYADYWTELGWISYLDEDRASARRCAEKAIELVPDDADALYLKAATLPAETKEEVRTALEAYEEVLEQNPDFDPAWGQTARLRFRSGDLEGAEEAARTALSLDPDDDHHRKVLYDVLKRRSWVYRVLRWPGDTIGKGFGLIQKLPWWAWILLCVVGIGGRVFLVLLALGLLWLTFLFPVLKAYEYLTLADVRRRAREIAPRRRRRLDVHRWPAAVRVGLFVALAGGLWYGAWRLLKDERARTVMLAILGVAFVLAVLLGLIGWGIEIVQRRRTKRRRADLERMLGESGAEAR
jgi:tetratricopeptide (TPR) repeat protein